MRRVLNRNLGGEQAGLTLVELLVGVTMGVIVLGAVGIDGDQRDEGPAEDQQERPEHHHRPLGHGAHDPRDPQRRRGRPTQSTASKVSFRTYVRHTACGSTVARRAAPRRSNAR